MEEKIEPILFQTQRRRYRRDKTRNKSYSSFKSRLYYKTAGNGDKVEFKEYDLSYRHIDSMKVCCAVPDEGILLKDLRKTVDNKNIVRVIRSLSGKNFIKTDPPIEDDIVDKTSFITPTSEGKIVKGIFDKTLNYYDILDNNISFYDKQSKVFNESTFLSNGLEDILFNYDANIKFRYRENVHELIWNSIQRESIFRSIISEYPDVIGILLGSSARREALFTSDVECCLIPKHNSAYSDCNQIIVSLEKILKSELKLPDEELLDYKIGTPSKIIEEVIKDTSDKEKEKKFTWGYTPLIDGIFFNATKREVDTVKDQFKDRLLKENKISIEGIMNWGVRQSFESLNSVVLTIGTLHGDSKPTFRRTSLLIRGLSILLLGEKESIKPQNKPFWLAPRYLKSQLDSDELIYLKKSIIGTLDARLGNSNPIYRPREIFRCQRILIEKGKELLIDYKL